MPRKIKGQLTELLLGRMFSRKSPLEGAVVVIGCILCSDVLRFNTNFFALKLFMAVVIDPLSATSFWIKDIGKALIAVVATVEISTNAPIINRLAWMSIPASKVSVMIFLGLIASLPVMPLIIHRSTSPTNAKLAKFFIIFRIFQRYVSI